MATSNTEALSLRTLKIMPGNLNKIVRPWIRLQYWKMKEKISHIKIWEIGLQWKCLTSSDNFLLFCIDRKISEYKRAYLFWNRSIQIFCVFSVLAKLLREFFQLYLSCPVTRWFIRFNHENITSWIFIWRAINLNYIIIFWLRNDGFRKFWIAYCCDIKFKLLSCFFEITYFF